MEASEAQTTQETGGNEPSPETTGPVTEAPQTSTPDVGNEGLSALEQRVNALEKPAETEDTPPIDSDLLEYLVGDEEEEEEQYLEDDTETDEQEDPLVFNSRAELDQYMQDQAAQVLHPALMEQAMKERKQELDQLTDKYEDLKTQEWRDRIRPILQKHADTYGNPHLTTDPDLVERVYLAEKAKEASDAETPAEVAGNAGASLETGAGPGSQGQEDDPEATFKKRLVESGSGNDAFS